jgi:hypothetical protein
MNSLETFLTILFIIIVYLVTINKMSTTYIMGSVALWFTVLWIGFDNMNLWKSPNTFSDILNSLSKSTHKPKYSQNTHQECKYSQPIHHVPMTSVDIKKSVDDANQAVKKELDQTQELKPKSTHLKYSEDNYKYNIFDEIGSLGDNMLAHKQKQRSNMNRVAMDNFSRMQTKNSNINYFAQELKDAAGSRWWDNEALEDEF